MHQNKIPEETITKILNMYSGGMPKNMISASLNLHIRTIRKIINKSKARICLEKFGKLKIIEPIKPKDLNMQIPINI